MKKIRIITLLLSSILISSCATKTPEQSIDRMGTFMMGTATPQASELLAGSLNLADYRAQWTLDEASGSRILKYVVYVSNPVDAVKECMTIFVPKEYLNDDGTVNPNGKKQQYTALTAPVIYKNGVSGYSEADAENSASRFADYLDAGFVVVSPASRGRQTKANDAFVGKSPAALVDLKAGIRFLKANKGVIPGDMERIISIGTSAGGAMSSLLGSTGDNERFLPYLREIGAVMNQSDAVYAAQCYCPVTDLDHADAAYEWMYLASDSFTARFSNSAQPLSAFKKALGKNLAEAYVPYANSLGLKSFDGTQDLTLTDTRSGSLLTYLTSLVEQAATTYLSRIAAKGPAAEYTVAQYIKGEYTTTSRNMMTGKEETVKGTDLSSFLSWDGKQARITDFDAYLLSFNPRMKDILAFDTFDLSSGEDEEFGTEKEDFVHFSTMVGPALEKLKTLYPEAYATYHDAYAVENDAKLAERVYLINPYNFVGTNEICTPARYFRFRIGTKDADTSFLVSLNLALKLQAQGKSTVDYAYVWGEGHGDADYPGELVDWIQSITK